MSALKYWLWLTRLRGLKNQTRLALLRHFGSPENVYYADEGEYLLVEGMDRDQASRLSDRSLDAADRILGECDRLDIRLVTMQDALYPGRLRDTYDPPCVLYVRGRLPELDSAAVVAVVGTRSCTPYGVYSAERLCYGLATGGAIVASGLAKGIDSAASRGALLSGGVTLGFLGCGLDVVYPKESAELYEDVAAAGALISEYPPGTKPLPGNFPQRNRILSGVSLGTLVVEAPARSGALITASLALDQGRDVFAVPGPIGAYASEGCNRLIQDGAYLVTDARDILEYYGARYRLGTARAMPEESASQAAQAANPEARPAEETRKVRLRLPEEERENPSPPADAAAVKTEVPEIDPGPLTDDQRDVLRLLDPEEPMPADDVIEAMGLPARRVLSALTILEIDGYVLAHAGKRYTRTVRLKETVR